MIAVYLVVALVLLCCCALLFARMRARD